MPRLVSIASGPGGHLCGLDEDGRLWRLMELVETTRSDDGHWRVEHAGEYRWQLWPLELLEEPAAEPR